MHVLIDQFSKFPVVTVRQSTGWESLKPTLEETLACHGIPEVITSDGGPPYGWIQMTTYCKNMGFKHRITTTEDAQVMGLQRPL